MRVASASPLSSDGFARPSVTAYTSEWPAERASPPRRARCSRSGSTRRATICSFSPGVAPFSFLMSAASRSPRAAVGFITSNPSSAGRPSASVSARACSHSWARLSARAERFGSSFPQPPASSATQTSMAPIPALTPNATPFTGVELTDAPRPGRRRERSRRRGDELHVPDGEPRPSDQVDPAQERRQRQAHLVLVGVLGREVDADARAHVEVDVGRGLAPGVQRLVRARHSLRLDEQPGLELRADHRPILLGARGEGVAMALDGLVEEERPHVAAGGGHLAISTTRAPSRSRSATQSSAASLDSVSRPSPISGARRRRPTVSPSSRGSGTARPASTDQRSATSSTLRPIGPTVSSVGTSGKTPSIGT